MKVPSQNDKIRQNGRGHGPWADLLNFGTFRQFGKGEARNFKFGVQIDCKSRLCKSRLMCDKLALSVRDQACTVSAQ